MATHIQISKFNRTDTDEIIVFAKDFGYVVFARREDLSSLRSLGTNEHRKPGIYVLMDDANRRYVGQASDAIINRLNEHDKRKTWWNKVLFFGRDDKGLDKSQLDYLERKLIAEHAQRGFEMDNGDSGNSSYIDFFQQLKADDLWNITQEILNGVANFNLFKKKRETKKALPKESVVIQPQFDNATVLDAEKVSQEKGIAEAENKVESKKPMFFLTDSLGNKVENRSFRQAYFQWVRKLYEVSDYSEIFLNMAKQESSIFKPTESLGQKGEKHTYKLDNEVHLFVRLNANDIQRRIHTIADTINIKVTIDKR